MRNLTTDDIVNVVGSVGSGKSTYALKYNDNPDYVIISFDSILSDNDPDTQNEDILKLRELLKEKYGEIPKDENTYYDDIVSYIKSTGKKGIIEGGSLASININKLKGTVIVKRTARLKCYLRSAWRDYNNPKWRTNLNRIGLIKRFLKCYKRRFHHVFHQRHIENFMLELSKTKEKLKYEDDRFVIYYNERDKEYIDKLIMVMKERMPRIQSFFGINDSKKIVVKLYDNKEEYKDNLISSFKLEASKTGEKPREYQDFMIANTEDGNINMLSLDLVRELENFKGYKIEYYLYNACHEFTHLCQQQIGSENPSWFWEVIATKLGNPECQTEYKGLVSLEDLNNRFDEIDGYGMVYKIGRYLFKNYDGNFILSMVKDNKKFEENIGAIIEGVNSDDTSSQKEIKKSPILGDTDTKENGTVHHR